MTKTELIERCFRCKKQQVPGELVESSHQTYYEPAEYDYLCNACIAFEAQWEEELERKTLEEMSEQERTEIFD